MAQAVGPHPRILSLPDDANPAQDKWDTHPTGSHDLGTDTHHPATPNEFQKVLGAAALQIKQ